MMKHTFECAHTPEGCLPSGGMASNLLFDAAASTMPCDAANKAATRLLEGYGSIHRGGGIYSRCSTSLFEEARLTVATVIGASKSTDVVWTANTTDSINKLAEAFPFTSRGKVLISDVEHSANDLPWRRVLGPERIVRLRTDENQQITSAGVREILNTVDGIELVALPGASNVTGQVTDLRDIRKECQFHGIPLFADNSQRMAHAPCKLGVDADLMAFSGHKIYAPFGAGVLAGPGEYFSRGSFLGGGSVVYSTESGWVNKPTPHNLEVGTPNGIGAVTLAAALKWLSEVVGYPQIHHHDQLVESWYRKYLPMQHMDVLWAGGAMVVWKPRHESMASFVEKLAETQQVEFRSGAFCAYEAFRRKTPSAPTLEEVRESGALPQEFGGIRFSAALQVTEGDVYQLGQLVNKLIEKGGAS